MNVRKPAHEMEPGYPSLRHLAESARRLGLAAIGAGAVGASTAAENPPSRLGGIPPPPKQEAAEPRPDTTQPRPPGGIRPEPPRLGGKIAVDPSFGTASTNAAVTAYVVKEGDTLSGVAQQKLGDASLWPEIAKLNPGVEPERLKVGAQIMIPAPRRSSPR